MSRALLDTDLLSEVLKQRDENVARAAADYFGEARRVQRNSVAQNRATPIATAAGLDTNRTSPAMRHTAVRPHSSN